jgi:hypothetical protein
MKENERRPRIVWLPLGQREKIAKALGCSVKTVSLAINGHTDNELARKVRRTAIKEYGGCAVSSYGDGLADEVSRDAGGNMVSRYGCRVKTITAMTGAEEWTVGIYINDELKAKTTVHTLREYMDVSEAAERAAIDIG